MKRTVAIALLLSLFLSFTACGRLEPKEISCEEIISVYQDAGYTVTYHMHRDVATEEGIICSIQIDDPENPERNYLYIDRYSDVEKAETAAKEQKYNIVLWFVFSLNGEARWLKSEHYGDIHYHTFNNKIKKPLEKLMK